jgi:radical SAM enzyme (TIGR01210 family)
MTRINKKFPTAVYPAHITSDETQTRRVAALDLVKTINEQSKSLLYRQAELSTKASAVGCVSMQPHFLDGEPTQRRIFYIRGKGCTWARAHGGGCLMCGHVSGMDTQDRLTVADYIDQFREAFLSYDYRDTKVVAIYNGGSLLSSSEIPPEVRDEILRTVASNENVEVIIFESLAELITPKSLASVREAIGTKRLQIGVGFESVNDDIRYYCVNKRNTLADYVNAFSVMREFEVEALAYCLMKPPFLDEQTAIDDCVKSVKFAFEHGVKTVSIEPVSVQDNTTIALLNEAGLYRSPWIWSLFEVVRQTHFLGDVRVGGFELFPRPRQFVHNCPNCDEKCYQALREYNATGKTHHFGRIDCRCKSKWRLELEDFHQDELVVRVVNQLNYAAERQRQYYDTGVDRRSSLDRRVVNDAEYFESGRVERRTRVDRRSGLDRRVVNDAEYFESGGVERRTASERRALR